ncbi:MAG: hypothetical protein ACOCNB_11370 [Acetivibrio ethanolgignens]
MDKASQGVKKGVTAIVNTAEKGYNTLKKEASKAGKTVVDTKKNEKPTVVTKEEKVNATVIRQDARGTKASSKEVTPEERRRWDARGPYIPKQIVISKGGDANKKAEDIHNFLSSLGVVPGPIGLVADGVNTIVYFSEGKLDKAAISVLEMAALGAIIKVGGKIIVKLGNNTIKNGIKKSVKKIAGEVTEGVTKITGKGLKKEATENITEKTANITREAIKIDSKIGIKSGSKSGSNAIDYYVGPNGKVLPSQYKDWIGTNIQEELLSQAENPQLKNAIKQLYRGKSFIGDGGTADVIRFEQETGIMLGKNGGSHVQKGIDMASYIQNKILTQNLSDTDRTLATRLLDDLNSVLGR